MNATAPRIANQTTAQGVELRPSHSLDTMKIVGILLCSAFLVTCLALYSVFLKFQIDAKYNSIQDAKKTQALLRTRFEKLEAEVNRLSSFNRIENVLKARNVALVVPDEVFYVDLSGSQRMASLPSNRKGM